MNRQLSVSMALIVLTGCGGGGQTAPSIAQPATSSAMGSSQSTAIATQVGLQHIVLPSTANVTGSMDLKVVSSSIPRANLVLKAQTQALALQGTRKTEAGFLRTAIYNLQLTASGDLNLSGLPALSVSSNAFIGQTPTSLSYQVFDDLGCVSAAAASQVALSVTGNSASFPALDTGFTLKAGVTYTFVFFLTSPIVTSQHIFYVAEPAANAVLALALNDIGALVTQRKIIGGATGLNRPIDVATDAAGRLYVLNQADATSFGSPGSTASQQTIEVFSPTASGNQAPLTTYTQINGNGPVNRIGESASGTLYVSYTGASPDYSHPVSDGRGDYSVSTIPGGYFTISSLGVKSAPITALGQVLSFAVSPDDRVAELTNSSGYDYGPNESSGPGQDVDSLQIGSTAVNQIFYNVTNLAFDPTTEHLVVNNGIVQELGEPGAFSTSDLDTNSSVAFDLQGELFFRNSTGIGVYANLLTTLATTPDGPPPGSASPDAVYPFTDVPQGAVTAGLALAVQ